MRPRLEPVPVQWFKTREAAEYANRSGYPEVTVEMIRANVSLDLLRAYGVGTGFFYRLRREDIDDWLERSPWKHPKTYHYDGWRWWAEVHSSQ